MKIAYIITAYTDPGNLGRLVSALGEQDFFIHIDRHVDSTPFEESVGRACDGMTPVGNVAFVGERVEVNWGGWSQVEALLRCLRAVREKGPYDRVVCLSGTDYPIWSCERIGREFQCHPKKEYMRACRVTGADSLRPKVARYWRFDYAGVESVKAKRLLREVFNRVGGTILYSIGARKKDYLEIGKDLWNVYFGSDYWGLTWDCAMFVLDMIEREGRVAEYFKSSYVPSELMLQTIVCNSPYAENIDGLYPEGTRYEDLCPLHYEVYEPVIQVMTESDYEDILASKKMFFRKCKTGESDGLVSQIQKTWT